ncbi:hypothetical protein LTR95_009859 [Oleoguttula sp. CCFEE 5521]
MTNEHTASSLLVEPPSNATPQEQLTSFRVSAKVPLIRKVSRSMRPKPETSPISRERLAVEVKGIYAGLVMVEAKCINIDSQKLANPQDELSPEQWQALIALHSTLLYEHHDFLVATQHPAPTTALRGFAAKYYTPARLWKHRIHAFLEVLRSRRPHSQEYMLSFISLAYQMIALLFETAPSFADTWTRCLANLAHYRLAIEEEEKNEKYGAGGEGTCSRYQNPSDQHPAAGRLYHHLEVLQQPKFLGAPSEGCCTKPSAPWAGMSEDSSLMYPRNTCVPTGIQDHDLDHRRIPSEDQFITDEIRDEASQVDIRSALEECWVLNLSMSFRDCSKREKLFVTYAKSATETRRVTITVDYRDPVQGSFEADLATMRNEREKSFYIFKTIHESLKNIRFYDTVTQLKLQTAHDDGQLHIYVSEDANEEVERHATATDLKPHTMHDGGQGHVRASVNANEITQHSATSSLCQPRWHFARRFVSRNVGILLSGLLVHTQVRMVAAQEQITPTFDAGHVKLPDSGLTTMLEAAEDHTTLPTIAMVMFGSLWALWVARRPCRKCAVPPSLHMLASFAIACASYVMRGAGEDHAVQRLAAALWCFFTLPGIAKLARLLQHPIVYLVLLITPPVVLALDLVARGWSNTEVSDTVLIWGPIGVPGWAGFVHLCQRGHQEWSVAGTNSGTTGSASSSDAATATWVPVWEIITSLYDTSHAAVVNRIRALRESRSRAPDEEYGERRERGPHLPGTITEQRPSAGTELSHGGQAVFTLSSDSLEDVSSATTSTTIG